MPITGLPKILVSSAEITLERKKGDPAAPPALTTGRIVKARVLQVISARQALLLIDGKKMVAKSFVPLKAGQEIRLQASRSGSQPVLRVVDERAIRLPGAFQTLVKSWGSGGPFSRLVSLLNPGRSGAMANPSPETATVNQLRQLVDGISLKSGDAGPRFLSDVIQGSGLLWEKKLLSVLSGQNRLSPQAVADLVGNDIKALAMKILQAQPAGGMPPAQVDALRNFVEGLENLQLFNKHADEEGGRYLLPLPVLTDGDLRFGQMLLTLGDGRSKSERDEKSLVKVSFLLNLSRLGDLRADFSVLDRAVSGAFGVATAEIRDFIIPHLGEITRRLQAHGYVVRDIACLVLGADSLSDMALFDQALAGGHDGVLNVVI